MNFENNYSDYQNISENYIEESEEEDSQEESEEIANEKEQISQESNKNKNKKEIGKMNENVFILSLKLLKKFKEMNQNDSDSLIIDFLVRNGLPMNFNNHNGFNI